MRCKLIFRTDNAISSNVHWRPQQVGINIRMSSRGGDAGVCVPMVAKWIQKSISLKERGVRFGYELGSCHLMGIVHSAFFNQKSASGCSPVTIENMVALLGVYNLFFKDRIEGAGMLDLPAVYNRVCYQNGYFILMFESVKGEDVERHVIGFRHEGGVFQMFDPNVGLLDYPDEDSFKEHVHFVFNNPGGYCDMNQYSRGNWWALLKIECEP